MWLATASPEGVPHLVPLSLCWYDGAILVAVPASSPTAANLRANGTARLAVGHTRDVVMIDVDGDMVVENVDTEPAFAAFAERTQWDIRKDDGRYILLCLRPRRVQSWRNLEEMAGRTLMRDGGWLA